MVDQLEVWTVRGRIATAVRNVQAALSRLTSDGQELVDAVADAERLCVHHEPPVAAELRDLIETCRRMAEFRNSWGTRRADAA